MSNDSLLKHPGAWFELGPGDDLSGHEPNRLWTLQPSGRYTDQGAASGVGLRDVSRGFAIGDIDSDGRADVLVANQWGDSRLQHNTSQGGNAAVWLRLRERGANGGTRPAIGAKIRLDTPSGPQFRQLYPANGHAGVSSASVSFGVGRAGTGTALTATIRSEEHTSELQSPI